MARPPDVEPGGEQAGFKTDERPEPIGIPVGEFKRDGPAHTRSDEYRIVQVEGIGDRDNSVGEPLGGEVVLIGPPRLARWWNRLAVSWEIVGDYSVVLGNLLVIQNVTPLLVVAPGGVLTEQWNTVLGPRCLVVDTVVGTIKLGGDVLPRDGLAIWFCGPIRSLSFRLTTIIGCPHQVDRPLERAEVLEDLLVISDEVEVARLTFHCGSIKGGEQLVMVRRRHLLNELFPRFAVADDAERPRVVQSWRPHVLYLTALYIDEEVLFADADQEVLVERIPAVQAHFRVGVEDFLIAVPPFLACECRVCHDMIATVFPSRQCPMVTAIVMNGSIQRRM
jgi:hypothetical protein